jgi:hypothetical protein
VPVQDITRSILVLRGQRVLLDAQLAALFGITTKRLNEQVRRNLDRFPADFMFQLTAPEAAATCLMPSPNTVRSRPPWTMVALLAKS